MPKPKRKPTEPPPGQLTFLAIATTPEQHAIAAQQQAEHEALAVRSELERLRGEVERWKGKYQNLYAEYEEVIGSVHASEAWWKAQVDALQDENWKLQQELTRCQQQPNN